VGYQTNLIVQAASDGELKNIDFARVGLPLVCVFAIVVPQVLLLVYP
jgi:di/tricarboxylate transporter